MSETEATLNCTNTVKIKMEAKSKHKENSVWLTSEVMALLCVLNGKKLCTSIYLKSTIIPIQQKK